MKSFFAYILSLITVVIFLISTSGITIYTHHCTSSNDTPGYSILESMATCGTCSTKKEDQEVKSSCCSITSCDSFKQANKCCTNETRFVKLVDNFDIPVVNKVNTSVLPITILSIFLNIDFKKLQYFDEPIICNDLLPPLKGKDIIVLFNQQKLPPALIV